ncbi:ARPP-1 family domain-containing protein [Aerosakkonema sp. BLCC-F183]|uniref:ARPP-1 family domain-containing protein n=1 Tax=Aerosakkonema sp. BLCC-F183 TaxID=3342834 RepID=UPI0035BB4DDB
MSDSETQQIPTIELGFLTSTQPTTTIFKRSQSKIQNPKSKIGRPTPHSPLLITMLCQELILSTFDFSPYQLGIPQQSGLMTVVPIFGGHNKSKYTGPLTGLKLNRVTGYGSVELANPADSGIAIVPLHIGYIQDGAQNHALCRSAFIAGGQKLMFEDACCVQQSQGGYLEGREQWFFILPVQLRLEALQLRGQKSYSKLWNAISRLNQQFNLPNRGHLEQIITRQRAFLTQYQSRFELLENQTGALFFLGDKLAGIEIAPTAAYFQEMWMPLVCFCYGTAAMYFEQKAGNLTEQQPVPFAASNLRELRFQLQQSRQKLQEQVLSQLAATPAEKFNLQEEERFCELRLQTAIGNNFAGQFVEDGGQLVYASLFAKPEYILSKNLTPLAAA